MNRMEIKEYLEQPFNLSQQINLKLDRLAILQTAATRRTAGFSATIGGSGNYHKMEGTIVKIAELEQEISSDYKTLEKIENEIEETIKLIEDKKMQFILIARYIYFESWGDLAEKMNYSSSYIFKMHKKALQILEDKLNI